jgi:hypothetical protein
MDQYIFLYPVKEYFMAELGKATLVENIGLTSTLFDIIDQRYRNNSYEINWLVFGKKGDKAKPYISNVPCYVRIKKGDRILSAGITTGQMENFKYPDSNYILDQLPEHRRLVLGGFHEDDCVKRLAKASLKRKALTFVDKDTTESFFRIPH